MPPIFTSAHGIMHSNSIRIFQRWFIAASFLGMLGTTIAAAGDLKAGMTFRDCPDCPEMVVIPAGSFDMGAKSGYVTENPVQWVAITKSFAMGKYAITRSQFAAFVKAANYSAGSRCRTLENGKWEERSGRDWLNPGYSQNDNHPAVCLNWHDAKAYSDWLSRKSGKQYRLPSEAEWEYSCRAASGRHEYCGSDNLDSVAWHISNSRQTTNPVGRKQANGFGLYDMSGNVWEWVEDSWHGDYNGAPNDGSAWGGGSAEHVLRGGSVLNGPHYSRAATRYRSRPANRDADLGFRLARTLP